MNCFGFLRCLLSVRLMPAPSMSAIAMVCEVLQVSEEAVWLFFNRVKLAWSNCRSSSNFRLDLLLCTVSELLWGLIYISHVFR